MLLKLLPVAADSTAVDVSILVLMDSAFKAVATSRQESENVSVSILVLMDSAFKVHPTIKGMILDNRFQSLF